MNRPRRALAAGITFILFSGAPMTAGQAVPDNFDKTHTITLKGQVAGFTSPDQSSPFYVHLNVTGTKGTTERWMIAGRPRPELVRLGWVFGATGNLKMGDRVTVTAYALKPSVTVQEALESVPPEIIEKMKPERVAHGVEVTVSGGEARPWGER
jgi:hypothetical protein